MATIKYQFLRGVLLIIILIGLIGSTSILFLSLAEERLKTQVPESIDSLSESSYITGLVQLIRYYDEVTTNSARNYAFTGEKKWVQRYYLFDSQLNGAFAELISLSDAGDYELLMQLNKSLNILSVLESDSFDLVIAGQSKKAGDLFESEDYTTNKRIIARNLENFINKRGHNFDKVVEASTIQTRVVVDDVHSLTITAKEIIYALLVSAVVLAILLGFRFSKSVSRRIKLLTETIESVCMGKHSVEIPKELRNSKDEIGDLSRAFKIMINEMDPPKRRKFKNGKERRR